MLDETVPAARVMTSPTAAPDTSVIFAVTSAPFSLALMKPSLLASLTMAMPMTGGLPSTAAVVSGLVLPAASVATTCSTVPSFGGAVGVMLYAPSAATVALPMTLPESSLIVTMEPTSAMPVIRLPLVGLTVGAAGDVLLLGVCGGGEEKRKDCRLSPPPPLKAAPAAKPPPTRKGSKPRSKSWCSSKGSMESIFEYSTARSPWFSPISASHRPSWLSLSTRLLLWPLKGVKKS